MTIRSFIRMLMLVVCLGSLAYPATYTYGAEPVKIGVLAFRPKPQTLAQWQPLAAILKQAIPEHDFVVEAFTYSELDQAVAARKLDFVLTNSGHYVLLKKRSGFSAPLATLSVSEHGIPSTVFGGVIFTRAGQGKINTLQEIKDKTVATVSTESLGGYQMQAYELCRVGLRMPQDVKLLVTGMPHDKTVEAVLTTAADVGFVRSGVLESMEREGKLDIKQLKILTPRSIPGFSLQVSTQLYPEWPFVAMPGVDENLAKHVAAVLFTLGKNKAATSAMGIYGFTIPADYGPVEDVLRELRLPPYDVIPHFTMRDVWSLYRWQLMGALLAFGLIVLLGVSLILTNRRLTTKQLLLVQHQQKLRDSEERWRSIVEYEPECVKLIDSNGCLLEMNPAGLAMIQATPDQVIGQQVADLVAEEDRAAFKTMVDAVFRGETKHLVFDMIGLHGRRLTLETTSVPLKNGTLTGGVKALLGVTRDITERKQVEAALRASEEKFRTVADFTLGWEYWEGPQSEMLYMSPSCEVVTGYSRAEFLADPDLLKRVVHSDDRQKMEEHRHDISNNEDGKLDFRIVRRDGGIRFIEHVCHPVWSNDGVFKGRRVSNRDVTERKQAEDARSQLSAIVERSLNEIYLFDSETLRFKHVNHGALKNIQYTLEEIKEMTPLDLKPEFTETSFRTMIKPLLADEQDVLVFETVHRRADGSLYPVEIHLQLVGAGQQRTFLAVIFDITERKMTEEALRESEATVTAIFRTAPVGIVLVKQREFQWCNEKGLTVLGYSQDELLGKSTRILYENDEEFERIGQLEAQLSGRMMGETDTRFRCKDGRILDIHLNFVLLDSNDPSSGFIHTATDITERKEYERSLVLAEKKWEQTFDAVNDPIMILDREFRIIKVNTAMAKAFELTPSECVGNICYQLVHGSDMPPAACPHTKMLQSGSPLIEEIFEPSLGGNFLVSVAPLYGVEGGISGSVHVMHDITALRKNTQEKERLIVELQDALAQIKTLKGIVPICSYCKKIRDDEGYWQMLEKYIGEHTEASFSHGICPECFKEVMKKIEEHPDS